MVFEILKGVLVNPNVMSQLNDFLQQLNAAPISMHNEMSDQLKSLLFNIEQHPGDVSGHHADLVKNLVRSSMALTDLLETLDKSPQKDETLLKTLREQLHRFNIESLMQSVNIPQQLVPLLFTQTEQNQAVQNPLLSQLTLLRDSLTLPLHNPIKAFIGALIDWHQSGQHLLHELDQISNNATRLWLESSSEAKSTHDRISDWAAVYDRCYVEHFQQPAMQLAQSDWLNHGAEVKLAWNQLLNHFTDQIGLPSPSQIDTLIEQLDQQRRRIRSLERRLSRLEE